MAFSAAKSRPKDLLAFWRSIEVRALSAELACNSSFSQQLFLVILNDLPGCLNYCEPFLYADDLKNISINYKEALHLDLDNLTEWGVINKMSFAVEDLNCFIVIIRGTNEHEYCLNN